MRQLIMFYASKVVFNMVEYDEIHCFDTNDFANTNIYKYKMFYLYKSKLLMYQTFNEVDSFTST